MNKNSFAPVVIFAYNRPDKLSDLLESLKSNEELLSSDLYFYIDSSKNNNDLVADLNLSILKKATRYEKKLLERRRKENPYVVGDMEHGGKREKDKKSD